jgi:hypothetical protein
LSGLGRFLEFSVRTPDILESLGWYRLLGFRELEIGDTWPHKYAVVSDGIVKIGLHDTGFDSPALSFVHQDLARYARRMTDHGFEFAAMHLDEDVFNRLEFTDRDGHTIYLLEARTFSASDDSDDDSILGGFFELSLPVRDAVRAAGFWGAAAPALLTLREEPTTHMRFDMDGIPLGLSESIALEQPALCFKCPDRASLLETLSGQGIAVREFPGFEGAFGVLESPEGTRLYVFDEDFLGESYEVAESDDSGEFPAQ